MLVRGRQNSKVISENCFKFEHLAGEKKKNTQLCGDVLSYDRAL